LEVVKLLSKYDCVNVQVRDYSGRSAMDLALDNNDNNFYDIFKCASGFKKLAWLCFKKTSI
jgi:hypothetical protein